MITLGLDLSLTSTGAVLWDGAEVVDWCNPKTPASMGTDTERIHYIKKNVRRMIKPHLVSNCWIERYALSQRTNLTRLGELGGVIKEMLYLRDIPFWDECTPPHLKKLATGNGAASKGEMVACAQEFWPEVPNDDCADGFHLARQAFESLRVQTEG